MSKKCIAALCNLKMQGSVDTMHSGSERLKAKENRFFAAVTYFCDVDAIDCAEQKNAEIRPKKRHTKSPTQSGQAPDRALGWAFSIYSEKLRLSK